MVKTTSLGRTPSAGRTPSSRSNGNGNVSDDDSEVFGGAIEEVNEAQFLEEVQLVGALSLPSLLLLLLLLLLSWRRGALCCLGPQPETDNGQRTFAGDCEARARGKDDIGGSAGFQRGVLDRKGSNGDQCFV
jgi:hypothetical protein